MPLFQRQESKLSLIGTRSFPKEIELQQLTEKNLATIFGLTFVATEFPIQGLYIDTLAFNEETKSFVIIEYKKTESFSVVDQGFSYLSSMLEHRSEFLQEYNERFKKSLHRSDIDWSQSRVVFISPSYTRHQIQAINFKDIPIELWSVELFENNTILYSQIKSQSTTNSITKITKDSKITSVAREVKSVVVEDHLLGKPKNVIAMFDELSLGLQKVAPGFDFHPVKSYIGYYKGGYNLIEIRIQNTKIMISLLRTRPGELNDPAKKMQYLKGSMEQYHKPISVVSISKLGDIPYVFDLISQLYEKLKTKKGGW